MVPIVVVMVFVASAANGHLELFPIVLMHHKLFITQGFFSLAFLLLFVNHSYGLVRLGQTCSRT